MIKDKVLSPGPGSSITSLITRILAGFAPLDGGAMADLASYRALNATESPITRKIRGSWASRLTGEVKEVARRRGLDDG